MTECFQIYLYVYKSKWKFLGEHVKIMKKIFLTTIILILGTTLIIAQESEPRKPATNVTDALKYERTEFSMPGKYPAKVIKVKHENSVIDTTV